MVGPELLGGDPGDELIAAAATGVAPLRQATRFARLGSAGLIGCGVVAMVTWVWLAVRAQQQGPAAFAIGFGDVPPPSLADRVNLFAASVPFLMVAILAVATGAAVRLLAAYMQVRAGLEADPPLEVSPPPEER